MDGNELIIAKTRSQPRQYLVLPHTSPGVGGSAGSPVAGKINEAQGHVD
jgi:hypothetical protein